MNQCPGAIILGYDDDYQESIINEAFDWCNVLAMGPGIGNDPTTIEIYKNLLVCCGKNSKKPVVIDADGLNIISQNMSWLDYIKKSEIVVFTPHIKELSRLLNQSVSELKEDLVLFAKEFAMKWKLYLVCKDAKTVVLDEGKELVYINQSGNHGMATAGSGDVLTGMIASLLCQETNPYHAITIATHMHGMAGDEAYKKYKRGLIASDIIEAIHEIV